MQHYEERCSLFNLSSLLTSPLASTKDWHGHWDKTFKKHNKRLFAKTRNLPCGQWCPLMFWRYNTNVKVSIWPENSSFRCFALQTNCCFQTVCSCAASGRVYWTGVAGKRFSLRGTLGKQRCTINCANTISSTKTLKLMKFSSIFMFSLFSLSLITTKLKTDLHTFLVKVCLQEQ